MIELRKYLTIRGQEAEVVEFKPMEDHVEGNMDFPYKGYIYRVLASGKRKGIYTTWNRQGWNTAFKGPNDLDLTSKIS